ncbi:MAG: hypothetical protein SRB2_03241 [Desulfobacteraceae bacterium Eth-SRB2]|nr:MAG: hypothetical protein SRB2_03241 [Desulfobacteraceae bacterium Eth-SRB2]
MALIFQGRRQQYAHLLITEIPIVSLDHLYMDDDKAILCNQSWEGAECCVRDLMKWLQMSVTVNLPAYNCCISIRRFLGGVARLCTHVIRYVNPATFGLQKAGGMLGNGVLWRAELCLRMRLCRRRES